MSQTNQFICLNRFDVSLCFFRPGSSQSVFVYCITIWIFLLNIVSHFSRICKIVTLNKFSMFIRSCMLPFSYGVAALIHDKHESCIQFLHPSCSVIILWHVIITCNYAIIIHFWTAAEVEVSCDSRVHINCH